MIAVEVGKVDITCLVVVAVDTVLFEYEQTGSICLSCSSEDAERLVTVEQVGSLTYLCADGCALHLIVDKACAFG